MSQESLEHPFVELGIGRVLSPTEIAVLTAANSTTKPEEAYKHALTAFRVFAIKHLKEELTGQNPTPQMIRAVLDTAWQIYSPVFNRATGPMLIESYLRAFRNAKAGDVPISIVYAMAGEHAERVGNYYNQTSTDALVQGYNTYVNRKLPARAALERVADAYGLTPRQMSGFTSATALQPVEVNSSIPRSLKTKIKGYIGASVSQRLKIFVGQEEHNLNEMAKQTAWLYLVENGRIPANSRKIWLTAEDEKVCSVCGPMQGVVVGIKEQFKLNDASVIYVPGAHVNCRCRVSLLSSHLTQIGKASDFKEREHPRGSAGRFVSKPRGQQRGFAEARDVDPALAALAAAVRAAREEEDAAKRKELMEQIKAVKQTPDLVDLSSFSQSTTDKVDFGSGKVDFAPKVDFGAGKVDFGSGKADLSPARVDLRQRLSLTEDKVDLSPRLKAELGQQLHELMNNSAAKLNRKTRKVTEEFRPVVKFSQPVYAALPFDRVDAKSGLIQILDDDELKPNRGGYSSLLQPAIRQLSDNQMEVIKQVTGKNKDFAVIERPGPMGPMWAEVDYDEIVTAVDAAVNKDARWATENTIHLTWRDRHGNVVAGEDYDDSFDMTPADLSKALKIDPEDLEVVVVLLAEGYEDATETRRGSEIWSAPGNYKIVGEDTAQLDAGPGWGPIHDEYYEARIPIRILRVEPDVQTIFSLERDAYPGELD